jgi:RNase P subunit RPR2
MYGIIERMEAKMNIMYEMMFKNTFRQAVIDNQIEVHTCIDGNSAQIPLKRIHWRETNGHQTHVMFECEKCGFVQHRDVAHDIIEWER